MFRSATLDAADAMVYHASVVSAWSREPYILAVSYGTDLQRGDIGRARPADEQVRRGVFLVRLTIAPRLSRAFRPPDDRRRANDAAQGSDPMIRAAHGHVCVSVCARPWRSPRSRRDTAKRDAVSPHGAPTSARESRIVADDRDYKIGPEDVLDISVWKNPELSRTVPVRPDGKVSLPLVNDIQAAGLDAEPLCARSWRSGCRSTCRPRKSP